MNSLIEKELDLIASMHGGILLPKDVVEFAEDKKTALHSEFCWDDKQCGIAHRLWQARQIIAVVVVIIPESTEPVRAYVNLTKGRFFEGGYKSTVAVLKNPKLREQMLEDAFKEFDRLRIKYSKLVELKEIFEVVEAVKSKTTEAAS